MSFEKPNSDAENTKSRTLSDAELLEKGGEISNDLVLDPTDHDKMWAKVEMEETGKRELEAGLLKAFSPRQIEFIESAITKVAQEAQNGPEGDENDELGLSSIVATFRNIGNVVRNIKQTEMNEMRRKAKEVGKE